MFAFVFVRVFSCLNLLAFACVCMYVVRRVVREWIPGPRKEIKVKGKLHLKEFLGITVELIKTLVSVQRGFS